MAAAPPFPKSIICSAPSGAGKTTILRAVMQRLPQLSFSVSATTRAPRPGEVDGQHYHFVSKEEFDKIRAADGFVEWEEVYIGTYYGTLKEELQRIAAGGGVPLFELDVKGGLSLKRIFGENALAIFLAPPSPEVLAQRLRDRGTETPEQIQRRIDKEPWEMSFRAEFDKEVVNNDLQTAIDDVQHLIEAFLKQD